MCKDPESNELTIYYTTMSTDWFRHNVTATADHTLLIPYTDKMVTPALTKDKFKSALSVDIQGAFEVLLLYSDIMHAQKYIKDSIPSDENTATRLSNLRKVLNSKIEKEERQSNLNDNITSVLSSLFNNMDQDASGSITAAEAARRGMDSVSFQELDADGDGFVDEKEWNDAQIKILEVRLFAVVLLLK